MKGIPAKTLPSVRKYLREGAGNNLKILQDAINELIAHYLACERAKMLEELKK